MYFKNRNIIIVGKSRLIFDTQLKGRSNEVIKTSSLK